MYVYRVYTSPLYSLIFRPCLHMWKSHCLLHVLGHYTQWIMSIIFAACACGIQVKCPCLQRPRATWSEYCQMKDVLIFNNTCPHLNWQLEDNFTWGCCGVQKSEFRFSWVTTTNLWALHFCTHPNCVLSVVVYDIYMLKWSDKLQLELCM